MASSDIKATPERNIEDIIDSRKRNGQFDLYLPPSQKVLSCRSASSEPIKTGILENCRQGLEDAIWISDQSESSLSVFPTDSEVTVVRVKRHKTLRDNQCRLNEEDLPGDGVHLIETASMINLVTLVGKSSRFDALHEYLVPLSSWETSNKKLLEDKDRLQCLTTSTVHVVKQTSILNTCQNVGARLKKFIRKKCGLRMKKSLDTVQTKKE